LSSKFNKGSLNVVCCQECSVVNNLEYTISTGASVFVGSLSPHSVHEVTGPRAHVQNPKFMYNGNKMKLS